MRSSNFMSKLFSKGAPLYNILNAIDSPVASIRASPTVRDVSKTGGCPGIVVSSPKYGIWLTDPVKASFRWLGKPGSFTASSFCVNRAYSLNFVTTLRLNLAPL